MTQTTGLTLLEEHKAHGGRVMFYEHPSSVLGLPARFGVFLPPSAGNAGKVPVVYALAGLTCTQETFLIKSGALAEAARLGIALVTPDTSVRGAGVEGEATDWDLGTGAGFYLDATQQPWVGHYRMGSYIAQELPLLVESALPLDGTRRGIMGHSMGGHGALVHGLQAPLFWKSVSAFAPIVHPSAVPWGKKAFTAYLGTDNAAWRAHDAVCLLEDGYTHPASILVDTGLADQFLQRELQPWHLVDAAKKAGQALICREHEGYDHSYWFVQSFVADHLRHHASVLGAG
ncbi:MAG: S-formylglutathione hydrolase [Acetobacter okinawensis]|uniref:S-formylglutathione hydrolase n=1 Tax=Acetobacter okinawensis TaxID=1076594 RepID=UPI001BA9C69A|nr:S-formylglutathione hydrolase [Acetobacter okinawensis]MBS0964823.1 S-formylglutathione hydrolase [Acetobacter okinawensis]